MFLLKTPNDFSGLLSRKMTSDIQAYELLETCNCQACSAFWNCLSENQIFHFNSKLNRFLAFTIMALNQRDSCSCCYFIFSQLYSAMTATTDQFQATMTSYHIWMLKQPRQNNFIKMWMLPACLPAR